MSGIVIKYIPLLSLSVEQLFYQNRINRQSGLEVATDYDIKPTVECSLIMSRLGLVFKKAERTGGFTILAPVSGKNLAGNDLLKVHERITDKLSFLIHLKNPEILNFNDLPASTPDDGIYYFSNQVADPAALRDDLHLTQNAAGVSGVNDMTKKVSVNYNFQYSAVVAPNTSKVKHFISGAEVSPEKLTTTAGQTELFFNLSRLSSGKCGLYINNVLKDEFYYLNEISSGRIFGVIELSLSNLLIPNYRLIEPDHSILVLKPVYKIRFVNRKTRWRYTVQVPVNSPLYLEYMGLNPADKTDFVNRLNIISNDTGIAFVLASHTDTLFIFESNTPQALQEKYISSTSVTHDALSLTLKKYIGNVSRETQVRNGLPFPATQNTDSSNFPVVISNIFITI